jgi:hypothetical protein
VLDPRPGSGHQVADGETDRRHQDSEERHLQEHRSAAFG